MSTPTPLNELRLNLLGKIFFTAAAAWIVGKATNLKIRGTPDEVQAVANAMMSSRRFQEELENPGATVDSVMNKLGLKHASAREFERILGIPFPIMVYFVIGALGAAQHLLTTFAT